MIYKCLTYNSKHYIKLVFDNVLIFLDCKVNMIKLYIFENDYYIFKEIEYIKVSNKYNITLIIRNIINNKIGIQNIYISYKSGSDYGGITLHENHYLIKLDKNDNIPSYFFKSIDDRENILAPLNEKINNVTMDYTLYQKLLDDLNINEILLDLLDSFGITINKFKFIE